MIGVTPPSGRGHAHVIEGGLVDGLSGAISLAGADAAGSNWRWFGHTSSSAEGVSGGACTPPHTRTARLLVRHGRALAPTRWRARSRPSSSHGGARGPIITGKTGRGARRRTATSARRSSATDARGNISSLKLAWEAPTVRFTRVRLPGKGRRFRVRRCSRGRHPLSFFGGASPGRSEMGAKLCESTQSMPSAAAPPRARLAAFRAQPRRSGARSAFNVSVRPIIAARRADAWDKANRIIAAMTETWTGKKGGAAGGRHPVRSTMRQAADGLRAGATSTTSDCGCRSRAETGALGNTS